MELSHLQLAAALDNISETIAKARNYFSDHAYSQDPFDLEASEWYLELAYTQLLLLSEALDLTLLRNDIGATLKEARASSLLDSEMDADSEPALTWAYHASRYRTAIQSIYLTETRQTVTKDLEAIIRGSTYAITDLKAFGSAPNCEEDVHRRIEALLSCIFPDLRHKPPIGKQIKNFVPDTGIPSISTLIEYKYLSDIKQVPTIAEEILADTRGYTSRDWKSFLYVVYETNRFKPEAHWRELFRECGISDNVSIIVLTGESANKAKVKRRSLSQSTKKKRRKT